MSFFHLFKPIKREENLKRGGGSHQIIPNGNRRRNMRDFRWVNNWEVEGGRDRRREWGRDKAVYILMSGGLWKTSLCEKFHKKPFSTHNPPFWWHLLNPLYLWGIYRNPPIKCRPYQCNKINSKFTIIVDMPVINVKQCDGLMMISYKWCKHMLKQQVVRHELMMGWWECWSEEIVLQVSERMYIKAHASSLRCKGQEWVKLIWYQLEVFLNWVQTVSPFCTGVRSGVHWSLFSWGDAK